MWIPHTKLEGKIGKGVFQINRLLQKKAALFPSGYNSVKDNFLRMSKIIQQRPETAKFGNYRLELEYNKGWYRKYTPAELAEELLRLKIKPPGGIYLDLHSTYNEKSSSTPFRLLVDPKRCRFLLDENSETKCSYNDLVTIPKYGLITPFQFSIRQMLYSGISGLDISTAFRTIQHSEATMLHNLTVFYEGKSGQPLLTPDQARMEKGQPVLSTYAFASLLFGIKDAPSLLGIALGQAVAVWTKHEDEKIRNKYFSHILIKVTDLCSRPYVDDLLLGGLPWEVLDHLVKSCPNCSWCDTCFARTLNNSKGQQHNDSCPLYVAETEIHDFLKSTSRTECGCMICPKCEFWQDWVRPGIGGVINFRSSQEYDKYLDWFNTEYLKYMCLTLEYLLMILTFSGFTTKGIETQHSQLRETYKRCIPSAEVISDVLWAPQPDVPKVISESQKITIKKNDRKKAWPSCTNEQIPKDLKSVLAQKIENFQEKDILPKCGKEIKFMTQMAKCIYSVPETSNVDRIRCRADGLEIENLKWYRNSGLLRTFDDFAQYMQQHSFVVTRRYVASFTGSLFDIGHITTNTLVALTFIKRAHHHLYLLPGVTGSKEQGVQVEDDQDVQQPRVQAPGKQALPDWDEPVPDLCRLLLFKSAQAFYLLKDRKVPRCNIVQHCSAGRMLVAMADSSIELSAERIFLITYYYINGKYTATNQCLHNLILINRPDLVSMPVKEGIALYKLVLSLAEVIRTLEGMGLAVPSDHISIVTDSHSTLILLRSISSYGIFQNKLKHLAAKTYAVLIALSVNVMRSVYSFQQENDQGIPFPADILTKGSETMSPASMLQRADHILNLPWLNKHPSSWPISRQIRESQANSFVGGDLLVDEAYISRLQQEVEYQQKVCVGKVAEPMSRPPNHDFGLNILSKQARQLTTVGKSQEEERKTFFVNLIKYRFSNILYEDSKSQNFRKVSLVGVLSLVVFWISRLRQKAKSRKTTSYYEARKQFFVKDRDASKSNWCGFLLCTDQQKCRHPTSSFGGRLRDGDGGLYVRQDGPHEIHRDKRMWGFTSRETDSLFSQPKPDLSLSSPHEGVSSYLQDGIYCSDQNCKLCNGPGKKVTFIHDFLEFLSDHVPEPAGGAEHWQWAQLCVQLAGHFSFHPLFRKILSERVLDLLAGAFPAKETMIDGMNLTHHNFAGGFSLVIANSRELRDTRQLECPEMMGRTMWRGISSKSHLATTLIFQLHSGTHHVGTYAVRFKLLGAGLLCNSVNQIASQVAAGCQVCKLNAIRRGRQSKLPKMKEKYGPLDLATIVNLKKGAPPTMICGDSIGPVRLICPCKAHNIINVHIMVYVDIYTLHVRYHVLTDMTTKEVLRDLINLISIVGPVEALVFDPSSIFRHFASTLGPIEEPQDENMHSILKKLNKRQGTKLWTRILHDQYVKNKLPPGLQVKVSPTAGSWLQGRCEERVRQLKITLSQHKIFGLNTTPTITLSDLRLHLAIAADVANNLPALAIGKRIFLSSNDLSSLAGRIGYGQANFPDILKGGGQDGPELLKCISETNKLASIIRSSIWALHLSRLKRHANWRGEARHGDYTDKITRGTICVDLKRVNIYKTLHQSMGKVELISEGKRWVLLSLVNPRDIDINLRREVFNCTQHNIVGCEECVREILKKSPTACTLVTRHVSHIYPIFNPDTEQTDAFCPRWVFPNFWHYERNDFTGGIFLHDEVNSDLLVKYEKELERLEQRDENVEL